MYDSRTPAITTGDDDDDDGKDDDLNTCDKPTENPRYRVIHGNSLAELDRLDEESIDGLVTDPPYSSGSLFSSGRRVPPEAKYQSHGARSLYATFLGETRDQRSHFRWMTWWLSKAWRVCKWGAPVCVFIDWRQLPLMTDALQVADWTWRGIAVWDKTESCRPQIGRFASQAEYIVWGSKGDMPRLRGVGALPGVFRVPVKPSEKLHMAGKPVALLQQLVKIVKPGGLVLDPFAGSGTVGVAALQTERRYIGIEMDAWHATQCREHLAAASENRTLHEARSAQLGLFAKNGPQAKPPDSPPNTAPDRLTDNALPWQRDSPALQPLAPTAPNAAKLESNR